LQKGSSGKMVFHGLVAFDITFKDNVLSKTFF